MVKGENAHGVKRGQADAAQESEGIRANTVHGGMELPSQCGRIRYEDGGSGSKEQGSHSRHERGIGNLISSHAELPGGMVCRADASVRVWAAGLTRFSGEVARLPVNGGPESANDEGVDPPPGVWCKCSF